MENVTVLKSAVQREDFMHLTEDQKIDRLVTYAETIHELVAQLQHYRSEEWLASRR